jgi:uncharacterized membrane protein (DUF106 family)
MEAYQEILLIALGLSILSALVSKFLANQAELKKARRDMEFFREKASQAQKSGDMKKSKEYMDQMLKASQSQFRHNLRPMMFSFIIFIVAIGWIGGLYADVAVPFTDASPGFTYRGVSHNVSFDSATNTTKVDLNLDGQFSQEETFAQGSMFSYGGMIWKVKVEPSKEILFQAIVAKSPVSIPFIGSEFNWFWWYLIIILPSSMIFRKLLDIV